MSCWGELAGRADDPTVGAVVVGGGSRELSDCLRRGAL